MEWRDIVLWGFLATVSYLTVLAGARSFHWTRLSPEYLLGAFFVTDRSRAKLIGIPLTLILGFALAFLYAAIFHYGGRAAWWIGALLGIAHATVLLVLLLPLLPSIHPRMASETGGPTARRNLEPPGALGRNYGNLTPAAFVAAHVCFGALLGWML